MDDDKIFKALADSTRRRILDALFKDDGQTLGSLCEQATCSRQGVSKHLLILERAELVATHFQGRQKLHYLNPGPLYDISSRWISKYARRRVAATSALKSAIEKSEVATDV